MDLRQASAAMDLGIYTIRVPSVSAELNDYEAKIYLCDIDIIDYEAREAGFITFTRQDKQAQD